MAIICLMGGRLIMNSDPLLDDADEDTDGDGFKNFIEYIKGTNPQDPESHPPRALPWLPLLFED